MADLPMKTTDTGERISIRESNRRLEALGRYGRWLYRRYQRLDLVEMAETTDTVDPISLRQVFVPMRIAQEDIRDEALGEGAKVDEESLPGEDAWEVLAKQPFVALSGRPGSGKTTLVQAVIMELCGEHSSRLRTATRAMPVPLILRTLGGLSDVRTLDDLLRTWWPIQEEQAEHDGMPLDRERIHASLFPADPSKLSTPTLLLFDGIDEIGGREIRQQLLNIATGARDRGFRVLVTGRPSGYRELSLVAEAPRGVSAEVGVIPPLHHLLPFSWSQIERFITSWYELRDEWQRRKKEGIGRSFGQYTLELSLSLSRSLELSRSLSDATRPIVERFFETVEKSSKRAPEAPFTALSQLGLRKAAFDWFAEQAGDPDLMRRRGLRPGEPLPRRFGFFDDDGRPLMVQKRSSPGRPRRASTRCSPTGPRARKSASSRSRRRRRGSSRLARRPWRTGRLGMNRFLHRPVSMGGKGKLKVERAEWSRSYDGPAEQVACPCSRVPDTDIPRSSAQPESPALHPDRQERDACGRGRAIPRCRITARRHAGAPAGALSPDDEAELIHQLERHGFPRCRLGVVARSAGKGKRLAPRNRS